MHNLPEHNYLKFNPDTFEDVRKLYDLHRPGEMKNAVDLLEDWVKKQDHFVTKTLPRPYLERVIIGAKGSIKRAQDRIERICTFRTLLPTYFGRFDVKDMAALENVAYFHFVVSYNLAACYWKYGTFRESSQLQIRLINPCRYQIALQRASNLSHLTVSRKLTPDHSRVIAFVDFKTKYEPTHCLEVARCLFIMMEYFLAHDYASSYYMLADYRKVDFTALIPKLNLVDMHQTQTIFSEGYGLRFKGIHIVTSSSLVDNLVTILKKVMNKKLRERIHTHKTMEDMHKYIPKNVLPAQFGGDEESCEKLHDSYMDMLCSEKHQDYVDQMSEARTNESKRQIDKFNEEYMGMPGTFRKFNLD